MEDVKIEQKTNYKVFISYSWTTPDHEDWVHNLAERLMDNGIEVKYDKWDLKAGQDKFQFMESMVKDENINKVLIICDKGYKQKADNRSGGVGTETQILTPELYINTNQTKFIPIIAEKGDSFDSYMPIFIKARMGIDMSSEEVYEDGYEKLLREIADRPKYRKPELGSFPSYILEDEKPHFKTKQITKLLKNSLLKNPEQSIYHINDFISEFKNSLNLFILKYEDMKEPYDEIIYSQIHEMMPLRNDYIDFLSEISKSYLNFDIDEIIKLFEDIYFYTENSNNGRCNNYQFDHYKFFLMELFLYTVIILIENNKYENLNIILNSQYFIKSKFNNEDKVSFLGLQFYLKSIEVYGKNRTNSSSYSLTAELLVKRGTFNNKSYKQQLLDSDLLLYYLSKGNWFPRTYVYNHSDNKHNLLKRLVSKRHFEKIKILFNVNTKEELNTIIENFDKTVDNRGYRGSFNPIPYLKWQINPEEICTSV